MVYQHNRLKVRTSAEMQAINKKKEEEKAAIYKSMMDKLLLKKNKNEYDEEMLPLTAEIILMNPDVATVWNMRKEYFVKLKDNESENKEAFVSEELKLTEAGLRVNPKSYSSWFHRCWMLDNFGDEFNWKRELQVCTKYLELDERNFHCWDYRKYVIERLRDNLEKELDYTLQKLHSNFSNYSAWHYRSKLIPRIHPIFEREKLFRSDIYQQEISLVENAVYTDPNDQSAWFYYRWLLGCISSPVRFVQAGYDQHTGMAWAVIYPYSTLVRIEGLGNTNWEHLNGKNFSHTFVNYVGKNQEFSEDLILRDAAGKTIDSLSLSDNVVVARDINFKPILISEEESSLKQQLESHKQLSAMEPNIKWPLLGIVLVKEKLGELIDNNILDKLKSIDNYRSTYYSDLISRLKIERLLSGICNWRGCFSASNSVLTAFYHSYWFTLFQEVDLSDNPLRNSVIKKLDNLLCCKVLKLSNCELTSIDEFPALPNLHFVDFSRNKIIFDSFPSGLLRCRHLDSLNFSGTLITAELCDTAFKAFPKLKIIFED